MDNSQRAMIFNLVDQIFAIAGRHHIDVRGFQARDNALMVYFDVFGDRDDMSCLVPTTWRRERDELDDDGWKMHPYVIDAAIYGERYFVTLAVTP